MTIHIDMRPGSERKEVLLPGEKALVKAVACRVRIMCVAEPTVPVGEGKQDDEVDTGTADQTILEEILEEEARASEAQGPREKIRKPILSEPLRVDDFAAQVTNSVLEGVSERDHIALEDQQTMTQVAEQMMSEYTEELLRTFGVNYKKTEDGKGFITYGGKFPSSGMNLSGIEKEDE